MRVLLRQGALVNRHEVVGAHDHEPPPGFKLSPEARQLLVEAIERHPMPLVVSRVVSKLSVTCRTEAAEQALADLAAQGLLKLDCCWGKSIAGSGYVIRASWQLTDEGRQVAEVEARS